MRHHALALGREYQVEVRLRALELPLPQLGDNEIGEGDHARADVGLRRTDVVPRISATVNSQRFQFEIDLGPGQAAKFGCTQAAEDVGDNERRIDRLV